MAGNVCILRLTPSLPLEEMEKRLESMKGKKTDAQRWQKFVPVEFLDQRAEFLAGHAERMRAFNKSDTTMKAFIRAHGLAYAFLRHKPYRSVEQKAYTPPDLEMVFQVILQNHPDQSTFRPRPRRRWRTGCLTTPRTSRKAIGSTAAWPGTSCATCRRASIPSKGLPSTRR
jgi:hypothetical protein